MAKSSKTKDSTGENVDFINVSFSEVELGKNLHMYNLHNYLKTDNKATYAMLVGQFTCVYMH